MSGPRRWTSKELATLRANASLGVAELARLLDRSPGSVRHAAQRFRVSLRRPGERRGLILGQVRGISLRKGLRVAVVSGHLSAELLERRAKMDRVAALCPVCGLRPVRHASTGWCTICHQKAMTDAYERHTEELVAQRAYDAAKQQRHRDLGHLARA